MAASSKDRLSPLTKLAYGAGDFGFAFSDTALAVLFAIFLTDVVGLAPSLAALAVFVGRSWDYVNDPLIGYLADRTRTRWGRRKPFLIFGFIPFGIAFAMLWWRPPFENPWMLAGYYALAYFCYDTMFTLVSMPFMALTPELTQDYAERTSLTSYRMAFSLLGSLVAFVVPLMMIGEMRPGNVDKVFHMGLIFGAACAVPLLFTILGTRERPEYASQPQPGLQCVEQAGLARPARPGQRADLPVEGRAQFLDAARFTGRGVNDAVADLGVHAEDFRGIVHQVGLVGDDDRGHLLFFGHHQETVQHAQLWSWLRTGKDEDGLVGVGQQNLLVDAARTRVQPHQDALPLLDLLDRAGAVR